MNRMTLAQIDTLPKLFFIQYDRTSPLSMSRMGISQIDRFAKKILRSAMATPKSAEVSQAIDSVYRSEWGRIIAILIRLVGDFDIAEEAAQEAFAAAVNQWQSGIPDLPRAWIIRTARYKAIDRLRRRTRMANCGSVAVG
jgi:Sigma-70 region 2